MSLDALLKNSDGPSGWRDQRKKLARMILGISIAAAILVGITLFISKSKVRNKIHAEAATEAKEVKSLAQLISLQNEAKKLRRDIAQMRGVSEDSNSVVTRQAHSRHGIRQAAAQIIDFDPGTGFSNIEGEKPKLYIPTGAVFIAQLITPIKTSLERTFVMAETIREFRMDMKRRVPKSSRLIGRSRLNPVLKGVIVEFDTLVLPNGIETPISGLGLSQNALPEIEGLFFSNKLETYGAALAFGFLSGFASGAEVLQPTVLGGIPNVSLNNQVLSGLSNGSFQVAQSMLLDVQNRAIEYVVVLAGEQIFVALTRRYDIVGDTK